jgi:hypothetical protein
MVKYSMDQNGSISDSLLSFKWGGIVTKPSRVFMYGVRDVIMVGIWNICARGLQRKSSALQDVVITVS